MNLFLLIFCASVCLAPGFRFSPSIVNRNHKVIYVSEVSLQAKAIFSCISPHRCRISSRLYMGEAKKAPAANAAAEAKKEAAKTEALKKEADKKAAKAKQDDADTKAAAAKAKEAASAVVTKTVKKKLSPAQIRAIIDSRKGKALKAKEARDKAKHDKHQQQRNAAKTTGSNKPGKGGAKKKVKVTPKFNDKMKTFLIKFPHFFRRKLKREKRLIVHPYVPDNSTFNAANFEIGHVYNLSVLAVYGNEVTAKSTSGDIVNVMADIINGEQFYHLTCCMFEGRKATFEITEINTDMRRIVGRYYEPPRIGKRPFSALSEWSAHQPFNASVVSITPDGLIVAMEGFEAVGLLPRNTLSEDQPIELLYPVNTTLEVVIEKLDMDTEFISFIPYEAGHSKEDQQNLLKLPSNKWTQCIVVCVRGHKLVVRPAGFGFNAVLPVYNIPNELVLTLIERMSIDDDPYSKLFNKSLSNLEVAFNVGDVIKTRVERNKFYGYNQLTTVQLPEKPQVAPEDLLRSGTQMEFPQDDYVDDEMEDSYSKYKASLFAKTSKKGRVAAAASKRPGRKKPKKILGPYKLIGPKNPYRYRQSDLIDFREWVPLDSETYKEQMIMAKKIEKLRNKPGINGRPINEMYDVARKRAFFKLGPVNLKTGVERHNPYANEEDEDPNIDLFGGESDDEDEKEENNDRKNVKNEPVTSKQVNSRYGQESETNLTNPLTTEAYDYLKYKFEDCMLWWRGKPFKKTELFFDDMYKLKAQYDPDEAIFYESPNVQAGNWYKYIRSVRRASTKDEEAAHKEKQGEKMMQDKLKQLQSLKEVHEVLSNPGIAYDMNLDDTDYLYHALDKDNFPEEFHDQLTMFDKEAEEMNQMKAALKRPQITGEEVRKLITQWESEPGDDDVDSYALRDDLAYFKKR